MTHAELLKKIAESRKPLDELVATLDSKRLAAPGPDGWAPKDYLTHVASWENWLRAVLEGRDRYEAMGIDKMEMAGATIESINVAVWEKRHGDSPQDALRVFRESHSKLMAKLEKMTIEDLEKPYSHYVPSAAGKPSGQSPMLEYVEGSTHGHYPEHVEWLTALLAS